MSVLIKTADGREMRYQDHDGRRFSYKTTDAGVLRVVSLKDGRQTLHCEYSPAGWLFVEGERFPVEITADLPPSNANYVNED